MIDWGAADAFARALLVDPQTSGGLLVALPASAVDEYVSRVDGAVQIGEVREAGARPITIEA
jgi:selenophosphate synthase